jgi:transcriptional regulator with XRE-family HTH domain
MPRKQKTADGSNIGIRIGRSIKIARTKLGMTQSELAEALDLENVTVSRIETGAQLPSIDRLDEIAKVLKISLQSLLADTDKAGAYAEMMADLMSEMAQRDREFVYGFALAYAQHLRSAKKK